MSNTRRGVVIGGSLAGSLVARVLARHVDEVVVVERDVFPDGLQDRKGVPQGHHAHILWSGGARIIESLYPGVLDEMTQAGAHQLGVQSDLVSLTTYGWQYRFPAQQYIIGASRALIESVLRARMEALPGVTVLSGTEVTGFLGDAEHVTGVRLAATGAGTDATREMSADIVVDAGGRGSRTPTWLTELGVPPVPEDVVDSGLVYVTRRFRPPEHLRGFPMTSLYADHLAGRPGRNGLVMPIEDGQWLVTLSGTRGDQPSARDELFLEFAAGLRHPLIHTLLADATPITSVRKSHSTKNRRLHFDRLERWPMGLVCVGDAVSALNPVYGHGMSSTARTARALGHRMRRHGLGHELFDGVQADIAAAQTDPWALAVSQDLAYPDCRTQMSDSGVFDTASRSEFADALGDAALRDPTVSSAYTDVASLSAPVSSLQEPNVLSSLRTAQLRPHLDEPPLSAADRRMLNAKAAT